MSTKRLAVLIVVVVGAFALTLGVVLATRGDDSSGYDDDTAAAFLADCTDEGGDDVAPACECWYDAIVDEIAYDRFEQVSAKLVAQLEKDPEAAPDIPDDFLALLAPCRIEVTPTTEAPDEGDGAGFSTDSADVPEDGSESPAGGDTGPGSDADAPATTAGAEAPFGD